MPQLYCNDRPVGWLFTGHYPRSAWVLELEKELPVPLAPHLPRHAGAKVESPEVRDFFVNYLPESPFAERVARRFNPQPRTDAQFLDVLGQELPGAFAVADGNLPAASYEPLSQEALEAQLDRSRLNADLIAFDGVLPRLSLAGAQDKFALWFNPQERDPARRFLVPLGRGASTHIFKPASTDSRYPMLPANEFATAVLASSIGLEVAVSDIFTWGGVRVLVSQRYDRKRSRSGAPVQRIHQIDLCQMLGLPRMQKYGSEAGIDSEQFFAAAERCDVPALTRRAMLRAWLFNYAIGNADAHAKNHSFTWGAHAGAGWQMAPLYDLLSVAPYLPHQPLSMGLLDEHRPGWFAREHWQELARLAGVTPAYLAAEIERLVNALQASANALAAQLRGKLLPEELDFLAEKVNPVVQLRCEWLSDAMKTLRARDVP